MLVFIFSGELEVHSKNCKKTIRKGEYIFLKKDKNLTLKRKSCNGESFQSVFMGFTRSFLCDFYCRMNKNSIPCKAGKFKKSIIELPRKAYIESIYISLYPYLKCDVRPIRQIMEIKLKEAVFGLLLTDDRFYCFLFDSDIQHVCIKQSICSSGYSFHVPKKSSIQTNVLIQRRWIVGKELETTYIKIKEGGKTTDVYMEISYKDVLHFRKSCDNQCIFPLLN